MNFKKPKDNTEKDNKRKFKTKYKDLKSKLKDTKILSKENIKILKRKEVVSSEKQDIKTIRKLNKTPKGKANLKNIQGNIIDVTNVTKTYITGNVVYKALKNVNISIKKGEIILIIGPSGSGKSTLLNILSGLDRPTDGKIIINNINISALKNNELTTFRRDNVGFIFQSYNLLPSLSARDNAKIGSILQKNPKKRIPVEEIFRKMDLINLIDSNIKNLSGGQQQKVSIARALSKNPHIIFADEPTGALDSVSASKIIDLLLEINKKYRTTIILVTHNPSLKTMADRILNVSDGNVSWS